MPYIKDRSGENLFWYFSDYKKAIEKHKESLMGADLSDLNLQGINLAGGRLERADLSGSNLKRGHFENTTFRHAYLIGTDLSSSTIQSHTVDLTQVDAKRASFNDSHFLRSDFSEGNFIGADFDGCILTGSTFHRSNLNQTAMYSCYLGECSFLGATLVQARLNRSIISGVRFDEADLRWAQVQMCGPITGSFKNTVMYCASFHGSILPKGVREYPKKPEEPLRLSRFDRIAPQEP